MPRTKRTKLTQDRAEDLESTLGDYLNTGNPADLRDVKNMLKQFGAPPAVIKGLVSRVDSIGSDLASLQDGNIERMFIDGVSEDLKRLDEFLNKHFDARDGRQREYIWEVWS